MHAHASFAAVAMVLASGLMATSGLAQESVGSSSDPLKVAPAKPVPGTCKQGYVWREARKGDKVCVTPATRDAVARANREAPRLWVQGAYGHHTCANGYVWREAFKGDDVCVRPEVREHTRQDNAMADKRRVGA